MKECHNKEFITLGFHSFFSCTTAILCGEEEDIKKQDRAKHKTNFYDIKKKYKKFLLTEPTVKAISLSPFWKPFTVM